MNNQKDNEKTEINLYGQNKGLSLKIIENEGLYDFVNKKTGKLVTAIYMVTDCMEQEDSIKNRLRLLGVNLLSDINKVSALSPFEKNNQINLLLSNISEILSLIEISHTIGYISEMNANILKKEFDILIFELESLKNKDKHFSFSLNREMFEFSKGLENSLANKGQIIKDNYIGQNKKTINNMSFNNKEHGLSFIKNRPDMSFNNINKESKKDRYDRIISIIKEKKNDTSGEIGLSIKDIALEFKDCSEKTIQRELNHLIIKGQIKKSGSKRWSRYLVIHT